MRGGDAALAAGLLEFGARTEVADANGVTPLMAACVSNNSDLVHLLLDEDEEKGEMEARERANGRSRPAKKNDDGFIKFRCM